MQKKTSPLNFILFFLCSALIFYGYIALQGWLNPPQPVDETQDSKPVAAQPLDASSLIGIGTRSQVAPLSPAGGALGEAVQLAIDLRVAPWVETARAEELRKKVQLAKAAPPRKEVTKPTAHHEEPVLGDSEHFKLRVKMNSRGGGVGGVTLNEFQAADPNGRPEAGKLELVPERPNPEAPATDLSNAPSNVLYHYAAPDDKEPLDSLGVEEWTTEVHKGVGSDQHDEVIFTHEVPGLDLRIVKKFTLRRDEYHIGLTVTIEPTKALTKPVKFRYQMTSGHGLPIEGRWYTSIFRNALVGRLKGNDLSRDYQESRTIGMKAGGDQVLKGDYERIQYAGIAVQYFASVIVVTDRIFPNDPNEPVTDMNFLAWARPTVENEEDSTKPQLDDIVMRVVTEPAEIRPGSPVTHKYALYYGPVKVRLLDDKASGSAGVSPELVARYIDDFHLNTLTDYRSQNIVSEYVFGPIGWTTLLITITNFMHGILGWLHSIGLPYGVCIIVLTVLVRGLMHPISRKQAKTSMRMQALMPELKKLQEKHKGDRQAMAVAQMELYRKHGVSPMGSCWIVFLQMPIFLGLYYALGESIHFRLAEFLWIKNLAAPDMLFSWGDGIPLISRPEDQASGFFSFLYLGPYFNILPVIAVAFMIVQQKFLMPPPTDEQQEMQQKMMKYMMIFFGLMFYKVAAGLCVYFIVSSVWGLCERKLLPKAKPATPAAIPVVAGTPPRPGPGGGRGGAANKRPKGPKTGPQTNGGPFRKVQEMWAELLKQAKKK
jgi:YidC/Oxa1 family membrane protein insertase